MLGSSGILLVLVCFAAGLLAQRLKRFPPETGQALNAFAIVISLPALVFRQIHALAAHTTLTAALLIPISMPWLNFAIAAALFPWFKRRFGTPTAGALLLTVGLGNTSFVGFPLLEAILGPQSIQTGVLIDQPGSFFVLATLGTLSVSLLGAGSHSFRGTVGRLLAFPPFIAMVLGLALGSREIHAGLDAVLERLGSTLVPIALVAVGYQLKLDPKKIVARIQPLAIGLLLKLVLIPAALSVLYLKILPRDGLSSQTIVLESAMAPMITAGILAADSDLDPELASLMVGVGILLSLVTVPLWAKLLGFI